MHVRCGQAECPPWLLRQLRPFCTPCRKGRQGLRGDGRMCVASWHSSIWEMANHAAVGFSPRLTLLRSRLGSGLGAHLGKQAVSGLQAHGGQVSFKTTRQHICAQVQSPHGSTGIHMALTVKVRSAGPVPPL